MTSENALSTRSTANEPAGDCSSGRSVSVTEECRQARNRLPFELLQDLDDSSSEDLYQHLRQCRSCLETYIALQAAVELAS